MKLETIRKDKKKSILIGGLIILILVSVVMFTTTKAKYKIVQSIKLATGTVKFKSSDLDLVAINISDDGTNYSSSPTLPIGLYEINTLKSKCRIPTSTQIGENAPIDENVSIDYINNKINIIGLTTKNTKCYVYFDKILDSVKPTISNVQINVSKTTIDITVTASDKTDNGKTGTISEYYYSIDNGAYIKKTVNTHQFSSLNSGSIHTIKVYVVDASKNESDVHTKENVMTTSFNITILNKTSSAFTPDFSYSVDNGNTWTNVNTKVASITVPTGAKVKSENPVHFCSTTGTSCKDSSSGYLGTAERNTIYIITGNEAIFEYTCLAEDTLIAIYDEKRKKKRNKKIKDIKVGDKVYAYDNKKKKMTLVTVKKVEKVKANIISVITLKNGEVIRCSREHGFYIENREFMMACELTKGLKIMSMDGNNYEIIDIKTEKYDAGIDLYNLILENGDNCFITKLGVMSSAVLLSIGTTFTTMKNVVAGTR